MVRKLNAQERQCRHTRDRLLGRYGRSLSIRAIHALNQRVWGKSGVLVGIQPKSEYFGEKEIWDLDYRDLKVRAVYDCRTKAICTVLPPDTWNETWRRVTYESQTACGDQLPGNPSDSGMVNRLATIPDVPGSGDPGDEEGAVSHDVGRRDDDDCA